MRPRSAVLLCVLLAGCGASPRPPAFQQPPAPAPPPAQAVSAPTPRGLVLHGPRARRLVALTFDADMTRGMLGALRAGRVSGWLDQALFAELRATRTPATIFLTGLWAGRYRQFVRALARDRLFELENHSLDHAGFEGPCYGLPTVATNASRRHEIVAAQRIIARVAHVNARYFRFPGGCHSRADVALVRSLGLRPVQWDVVSGDAFEHDPAAIVRNVLRDVRPGSIVIAHCIGAPNTPATAAAMELLIPALRARGYRLVSLRQLLSA